MNRFSIASLILIAFLIASVVHFDLYKRYRSQDVFLTQMLYLPSGKYLKPASFGYYAIFADFIYLWSIQYYGDPGFHPRMEYLKHTYDIITELDPRYMDAYQTGALFMFYEGRNPKGGLQLLDQGLEKNPEQWILPLDAGFYCMMRLGDKKLAAEYFEKAAKIPRAHSLAKRALASMRFKLGDKVTALHLWMEVLDTAENATIKQSAYQQVHDLRVLIDLDVIRAAISEFESKFGKHPFNLQQLVTQGFLKSYPYDPEENEYEYNVRTGHVQYSKQLTLYKKFNE
jgi:tetratricopeptide (TPR) repeat protein